MRLFFSLIFISVGVWADVNFQKELDSLKSIGSIAFDKNEKADLYFVDFWASWCEPCKESFPYYEEKIKKMKNKKIALISVNLDDEVSKAEIFLKQVPQNNAVVWDQKRKFMSLLKFEAIPMLIILNKDWKEIDRIKGFNSEIKKRLDKYF